jgi:drug/metabolite transporter (DMT)-like permease
LIGQTRSNLARSFRNQKGFTGSEIRHIDHFSVDDIREQNRCITSDHIARDPLTRLRFAAPEKALGYQVATSIPILGLAAWLFGETIPHTPSPLSLGLMAFQAIWVVGTTFTLWFALVKTYSASKLSAFTFITPLFGVVGSYFIMHDTLNLTFGAAAVLVIAGLFLVNRPSQSAAAPRDALLNVTKT